MTRPDFLWPFVIIVTLTAIGMATCDKVPSVQPMSQDTSEVPVEFLSADTVTGMLQKTWTAYDPVHGTSWCGYMLDTIQVYQEGERDSIWADDTVTVSLEWRRNMRTGDKYEYNAILGLRKSEKHKAWEAQHFSTP